MTTDISLPGRLMAAEIAEQPERLADLLNTYDARFAGIAAAVRADPPAFAVIAARGTSDHAALYLKYLLEVRLGLTTSLASPSAMTLYDARPRLDRALWIAISQSGGSPDLIESTRVAGECGARTISITNTPGSALAATADHGIDIASGPERAVAATKTYTSELLACWLLVEAIGSGDAGAARSIPALAQDAAQVDVSALTAHYDGIEHLVVVGRGYAYPTAREGALKLMETSYLSAQAYSGADLLHGPVAIVDGQRPVLAVLGGGRGDEAMRPVLERLAQSHADLSVIGSPAQLPTSALQVPVAVGVSEDLAPILQIIPLQRLALEMAVSRGHDPDAPRGLLKITETH